MNALTPRATTISAVWQRRLAKTALRRRIALPARQLSSSAPVFKQGRLPPAENPYASTALASLLARLSLPSTPELQATLLACLTHPSFLQAQATSEASTSDSAEASSEAEQSAQATNELLASLGNSLLGLFAAEELAARYPHLPAMGLQQGVTAFVGPSACVSVGRELGISVSGSDVATAAKRANPVLAVPIRWKRLAEKVEVDTPVAPGFRKDESRPKKQGWEEGVASVVRAFVGLIYQAQGMHAAREFVHAHFMSRHVEMSQMFNFARPKHVLSTVVSKHLADAGVPASAQTGRIVSRVLASTGVNTQAPLFNIGLFLSNGLKLAEGHGSSLAMAEHRAAMNALFSLFLVRGKGDAALPSALHAARPISREGLQKAAEGEAQQLSAGNEAVVGLGKRMARH